MARMDSDTQAEDSWLQTSAAATPRRSDNGGSTRSCRLSIGRRMQVVGGLLLFISDRPGLSAIGGNLTLDASTGDALYGTIDVHVRSAEDGSSFVIKGSFVATRRGSAARLNAPSVGGVAG